MTSQSLRNSGKKLPEHKHKSLPELLDDTVTSTYEDVMAIIEAKTELVKIDLTKKIAVAASILILVVVLLIGVAYLITTLALLLGELTGHLFAGYLLVSLAFLSCFFFFMKFKPDLLPNLIQKILLSSHDYK